MKTRLALTVATAVLLASQLQASQPPPAVPDSGGTAGVLALGLFALLALRRRFTK